MATTLFDRINQVTTATMVVGVGLYSLAASLPLLGIFLDLL